MKHGCYAIDQLQTIITLLNVIQHVSALVQEGYGYGCITQLVFDPLNPQFVFTSSVNGTVTMRDLDCRHSEVFIDMMDISYWWTSLSYCESKKLLFIGGNTGRAIMMDRQGNKVRS